MSSSNIHDQLPSEELTSSRRVASRLGLLGILDVAVTFTYLMINGLLDGGASGWDVWMMIFQVLHMWSWALALSVPAVTDAGSLTYMGMTFATYVLAWILDFAGILTRVILVQTGFLSWTTFEIVVIALVVVYNLVDAFALLFVAQDLSPLVQHKRKVQVALHEIGRRSKQPVLDLYDQLRRVPEVLRFSREQHRQLVILQFFIWILLFLFFDLGLVVNTTFQQLYWAQVVAGFLWPFGYALAEGVHNYAYLWFYLFLLCLDCAGSIFAQVWRTVLLSSCTAAGSGTSCTWFLWAGWITFLVVMVEIVLDVYLLFLVYVAIRQTQRDRARVQEWKNEALPERIRMVPVPTGVLERLFASPSQPLLPPPGSAHDDDDDDDDNPDDRPRIPMSQYAVAAGRQQQLPRNVAQAMMPPAAAYAARATPLSHRVSMPMSPAQAAYQPRLVLYPDGTQYVDYGDGGTNHREYTDARVQAAYQQAAFSAQQTRRRAVTGIGTGFSSPSPPPPLSDNIHFKKQV